jgi:hypothetical protein
MSSYPVISCPNCLRQYAVEPSLTLAQCGACKSHFQVAVAEMALPCEAVTLSDPITPHYNFLYEATAQAARNVKTVFNLADEPFIAESAARFIQSLHYALDLQNPNWREEYSNRIVLRASENARTDIDRARLHEATTFYFAHMHTRHSDAQDMLIAAFAGVLSVEYEVPSDKKEVIAQKMIAKPYRSGWRSLIGHAFRFLSG